MVYHLVLCSLRQGISPDEIEEMMRRTRMSLLKIDVALSVRCGHLIEEGSEGIDERIAPDRDMRAIDQWEFFVAIEVNSMERLAAYREHPVYVKYMEEVLKPQTRRRLTLNYETDPQRQRAAGPASRYRAGSLARPLRSGDLQ